MATPQQIGVLTRDGHTLMEKTRCIFCVGDFSYSMMGELILTATYFTHISPHSALEGNIPYFMLYGKDLDHGKL